VALSVRQLSKKNNDDVARAHRYYTYAYMYNILCGIGVSFLPLFHVPLFRPFHHFKCV